jgi:hypothetical protein
MESDSVPCCIVTDFGSRRVVFRRLREGPLAYGLLEPFAPVTTDPVEPLQQITVRTHYRAFVDTAAAVFGALDTQVHLPWRSDGRPWRAFSAPVGMPGKRLRARFELDADASTPNSYLFSGEEEDGSWTCPVCGRVCPTKEPHTAAHGIPGHLFAAEGRFSYPSDVLDITRPVDNPNTGSLRLM